MEIRYIDYGEGVGALKPLSRPPPPPSSGSNLPAPGICTAESQRGGTRANIYVCVCRDRAIYCVYRVCIEGVGCVVAL